MQRSPTICVTTAAVLLAASWFGAAPAALAQSAGETPRQFVERREAELAKDDVWGHLELADLAHGVGLTEAAKKHATAGIGWQPEIVLAREILGHTRVGKKWLTPAEAKAAGLVEFHDEVVQRA